MFNQVEIESASIKIGPLDSRCRYWAKIIRAGQALPLPSAVDGASDIPGGYIRNGPEELFPGDMMIEGEENSHRKARGWRYWVSYLDPVSGAYVYHPIEAAADKDAGKALKRLSKEALAGSGDVAAAVRYCHLLRAIWADGLPASMPTSD